MKAVIIALTLAAVASTAPLDAQVILGGRPTSSTRGTSVNGSWQVVGQDRSGTIYERQTYDANGNLVVQRARRDGNGNFSILSSRVVQRNTNGRDCQVNNGSVGSIIFGNGSNDCSYDRGSSNGVWRQVGQGRNNNSIYERRTIDANGNVVIQRARRNSNGSFTILSSRTVRGNEGVRDRRGDDDDDRRFNRNRGDDDDDDRFSNSEHHGRGRGKGHKGRD